MKKHEIPVLMLIHHYDLCSTGEKKKIIMKAILCDKSCCIKSFNYEMDKNQIKFLSTIPTILDFF